jgi:hypothetical protein
MLVLIQILRARRERYVVEPRPGGGLAAIAAGALLLILDAWGLVLELLGAYPENLAKRH